MAQLRSEIAEKNGAVSCRFQVQRQTCEDRLRWKCGARAADNHQRVSDKSKKKIEIENTKLMHCSLAKLKKCVNLTFARST